MGENENYGSAIPQQWYLAVPLNQINEAIKLQQICYFVRFFQNCRVVLLINSQNESIYYCGKYSTFEYVF